MRQNLDKGPVGTYTCPISSPSRPHLFHELVALCRSLQQISSPWLVGTRMQLQHLQNILRRCALECLGMPWTALDMCMCHHVSWSLGVLQHNVGSVLLRKEQMKSSLIYKHEEHTQQTKCWQSPLGRTLRVFKLDPTFEGWDELCEML